MGLRYPRCKLHLEGFLPTLVANLSGTDRKVEVSTIVDNHLTPTNCNTSDTALRNLFRKSVMLLIAKRSIGCDATT